jgi:hypothetical protein
MNAQESASLNVTVRCSTYESWQAVHCGQCLSDKRAIYVCRLHGIARNVRRL